ncbi:GNAT family N-acetyltransferase [Psychromarinibacter sp. C21-152]|uniref:GNAT family N-acetyltransferase n=1 Tax=Psychromarinibacter sediminicola TaxID=3033385 RepID=A0AAE3NV84_9RHOB|nr:GNAT family N-acetyltransferase [Psychromarinibacter sediminicola]MDF0601247.1 GNAT family N-acetyltransferase [Psychromarinibacter sediminicola]
MTPTDLDLVLSWAEAEGWNPGIADAAAFRAADPEGFLVSEVDGTPAASLSIVRFGDATAFLGLYICGPDFRGQGVGYALWQAGMARLAPRTTGLDGVPAQQANYARSGFVLSHRNLRYSGVVAPAGPDETVPLAAGHIDAALSLDRAVTGYDRSAFLLNWLTGDPSRQARALIRDGALAGLGVLRRCVQGHKVGPLFARDRAAAEAVLDGLAGLAAGERLSLDVSEPNDDARALAEARGLAPDFETARMWRGPAPQQDLARTFGVTTFELG